MKKNPSIAIMLALFSVPLLNGCGGSEGSTVPPPAPAVAAPATPPNIEIGSLPGLPVASVQDPAAAFKNQARYAAGRYGGPRSDPFALKSGERAFDVSQNSARIMGDMGGFTVVYEPPAESETAPPPAVTQPQPYRRLSGIVVGDSVYAILEEANGPGIIIRPGMRIPDTEWTVVAIDLEKATLRRGGNVLPKQVIVRLESPPPGMGGGGANPGGGPGGMPGGLPGGPPGRGPGGPGGPGGVPTPGGPAGPGGSSGFPDM